MEQALKIIEEIAPHVDPKDKEALKKVAMTSMASKLVACTAYLRSSLCVNLNLDHAVHARKYYLHFY